MIKQIKIQNFKSIINEKINLKNINIFCGENASGKTSCIHALLSILQNKKNNFSLDGNIIRIGTFDELKSKGQEQEIRISIQDSHKKIQELKFYENSVDATNKYAYNQTHDDGFEELIFDNNLFYISSNRSIFKENPDDDCNLGINGQNAFMFLQNYRESVMPEWYMNEFCLKFSNSTIKNNRNFEAHVRFWFEFVTSESVNVDFIPYTYNSVLTYGSDQRKRPINTGTGLSCILPILVTCLGSLLLNNLNEGLIIIENPEIYLHPLAQMKLMEFLNFIGKFTQLIIETHSEYVLKYAIEKKSKRNQICIFRKDDKNGTKIKYLKHNEFKLIPYTYSELLLYAFNIYTAELHILLFSKMQEISGKFYIKDFDTYLLNRYGDIPKKRRKHNNTIYVTLPVFIRNCIDHPEQKNDNGRKYTYTNDELKKSIDFMLSKLN